MFTRVRRTPARLGTRAGIKVRPLHSAWCRRARIGLLSLGVVLAVASCSGTASGRAGVPSTSVVACHGSGGAALVSTESSVGHGEPDAALDPTNPGRVLIASQAEIHPPVRVPETYFSVDGGLSW